MMIAQAKTHTVMLASQQNTMKNASKTTIQELARGILNSM